MSSPFLDFFLQQRLQRSSAVFVLVKVCIPMPGRRVVWGDVWLAANEVATHLEHPARSVCHVRCHRHAGRGVPCQHLPCGPARRGHPGPPPPSFPPRAQINLGHPTSCCSNKKGGGATPREIMRSRLCEVVFWTLPQTADALPIGSPKLRHCLCFSNA